MTICLLDREMSCIVFCVFWTWSEKSKTKVTLKGTDANLLQSKQTFNERMVNAVIALQKPSSKIPSGFENASTNSR